jgi:REP element-mobilizing transposase RayT
MDKRPQRSAAHYLPRLQPEFYRGDAVVHWTLPVAQRKVGWLESGFHQTFRELLLHAAGREGLACPAYCLMPDHIHLVWMGLGADSDQRNGMAFLRTHIEKLHNGFEFQHQAHDHVLRDEERRRGAFASVCAYVLANPVRAGLVKWSTRGNSLGPLFWAIRH